VLTGLITLVAVLASASAAGCGMRLRNGRLRARGSGSVLTVFLLEADGSIMQRASGQPRKADVLAAVSSVLDGSIASRE
jgi:hypothetical protein